MCIVVGILLKEEYFCVIVWSFWFSVAVCFSVCVLLKGFSCGRNACMFMLGIRSVTVLVCYSGNLAVVKMLGFYSNYCALVKCFIVIMGN